MTRSCEATDLLKAADLAAGARVVKLADLVDKAALVAAVKVVDKVDQEVPVAKVVLAATWASLPMS